MVFIVLSFLFACGLPMASRLPCIAFCFLAACCLAFCLVVHSRPILWAVFSAAGSDPAQLQDLRGYAACPDPLEGDIIVVPDQYFFVHEIFRPQDRPSSAGGADPFLIPGYSLHLRSSCLLSASGRGLVENFRGISGITGRSSKAPPLPSNGGMPGACALLPIPASRVGVW